MVRIRPIPNNYKWAFMVAPHHGVIALGYISGDQISDIRATAERCPNGEWWYRIYDTSYCGGEPSKSEAIKTVTKIIKSLLNS